MRDAKYFTRPRSDWQRRYEALRASLVEGLPDKATADRFGYTSGYVRVLKHNFRHGKLDFSEPVPDGGRSRPRVTGEIRRKIRQWVPVPPTASPDNAGA
ncbi:hypothetical protein ACFL6C_12995 [Myxococcota bacterium]